MTQWLVLFTTFNNSKKKEKKKQNFEGFSGTLGRKRLEFMLGLKLVFFGNAEDQ